ncbi:MAG: ubiquinone biosynthesis regulatory protein kinase UbiB, partial [Mehylophilales bacterium 35-46-6]
MRIFRLIYIIFIALRFGLDEFILSHTKLKPLQYVLNTLLFWRNKQIPRGERLRLALESLGPIFVKFGQMLSTRRDLIAPDIADELTKLQDQVPPFAFTEVERVITNAFEQPLSALFLDFDEV